MMKQCHYIKLKTVSITQISFIIQLIYNLQGTINIKVDRKRTRLAKKPDQLKDLFNKYQA